MAAEKEEQNASLHGSAPANTRPAVPTTSSTGDGDLVSQLSGKTRNNKICAIAHRHNAKGWFDHAIKWQANRIEIDIAKDNGMICAWHGNTGGWEVLSEHAGHIKDKLVLNDPILHHTETLWRLGDNVMGCPESVDSRRSSWFTRDAISCL